MELIDKFADEILKNKSSFEIIVDKNNKMEQAYHFIQDKIGKAAYVYGMSSYGDDNFYTKLDNKPKIVAVVSERKVYIIDTFFFGIYTYRNNKIIFPDNVAVFDDYVKECNNYVCNIIFPEFYEKLDIDEHSAADLEETCKQKARAAVLDKNNNFDKVTINPIFNRQDIADIICGSMDFEEETERRLNSDREEWVKKKSINKKIREYVDNSEVALLWERKIADGIAGVEAKTVTAEFELNGIKASAKINPEIIIRKMIDNGYFSGYDFEVVKRGNELIKKLGAKEWGGIENVLRCRNITKITYGRKELYVRA